MSDQDRRWRDALFDLVRATHFLEPGDLPAVVRRVAAGLGARDGIVYLIDHDQHELRHLPVPGEDAIGPLPVDGTLMGRAFQTLTPTEITEGGDHRLFAPLLDGTDRLGIVELRRTDDAHLSGDTVELFAALIAHAIVAKTPYGDAIEVTRRRRPMALRAEAQRELLPPLTFISPRLVVTGALEPALEVAGDVFDYAVNGDTVPVAILDAMGHSLNATLMATVATAAYRNARRRGGSLLDSWELADRAVAREFDGDGFVTAIFAEVDLRDGRVLSLSAGHPSALVVRDNRVIGRCADEPTLPLGLRGDAPTVITTHLHPGDRLLLFTDGIVEARAPDGRFFGEERLVEHLARELDSELPAPEAVRRLVGTVVEHQGGQLRDDATLVLVEWRGAEKD